MPTGKPMSVAAGRIARLDCGMYAFADRIALSARPSQANHLTEDGVEQCPQEGGRLGPLAR